MRIGLISYSLYLWHYPIFLFWRTNFGLDTMAHILSAILVTSVAALFSYRMVESRLRYSKAPFTTALLPGLLCAIVLLSGFGWLLQGRPGIFYLGTPQQWSADWDPSRQHPFSGGDRILASVCEVHDRIVPADVPDLCFSIADTNAGVRKTLLVAGDSHAYADWGMAAAGAEMNAFRFATLVYDGCGPGANPSTRAGSCSAYWNGLPAMVRKTLAKDDNVLIALLWGSQPEWRRRAGEAITAVALAAKDRGAKVIIEAPLPTFDRPAYLCTMEWFRHNYDGCSTRRIEVERDRAPIMADLSVIARDNRNVRIWDPLSILCPKEVCAQFRDGKPLFRDQNHLSCYGSRWLAPAFVQFLAEADSGG